MPFPQFSLFALRLSGPGTSSIRDIATAPSTMVPEIIRYAGQNSVAPWYVLSPPPFTRLSPLLHSDGRTSCPTFLDGDNVYAEPELVAEIPRYTLSELPVSNSRMRLTTAVSHTVREVISDSSSLRSVR